MAAYGNFSIPATNLTLGIQKNCFLVYGYAVVLALL